MANRFQIIAVNDARSFCECCGRQGLKLVVWVLDTETGDEKHFGTTCANAPAKGFGLKTEVAKAVRGWKALEQSAANRAGRAYRAEGGQYINGTDAQGPFSKPVDQARWNALYQIALTETKQLMGV